MQALAINRLSPVPDQAKSSRGIAMNAQQSQHSPKAMQGSGTADPYAGGYSTTSMRPKQGHAFNRATAFVLADSHQVGCGLDPAACDLPLHTDIDDCCMCGSASLGTHARTALAQRHGLRQCLLCNLWHRAMIVTVLCMQDYVVHSRVRNVLRALIVLGVFAAVITLIGRCAAVMMDVLGMVPAGAVNCCAADRGSHVERC